MPQGYTACPRCGASGVALPGRTDGTAVASLVLGIVGLVACPVVASVLAVVLGNQAKAKIAANPGLDGEGFAKAGVILGWVGLAVIAGTVLLAVLAFAIPFGLMGIFP